jgi:pyrophosphatase PpaX
MLKFDGYLFDLDGTLLNTIDLIVTCIRHTLAGIADVKIPEEKIRKNIGIPLIKQYMIHLAHLDGLDYQKIVEDHLRYQSQIWKEYVRMYEGIPEMLKVLYDHGKKMAIVTSRRLDAAEIYLDEMNIRKYFPVIITPAVTEKHKPDAEPALYAANMLKIKPEKCVMIGDSVFDVLCGKNAGMKTVFAQWGALAGKIEGVISDYVVKNPGEILSIEGLS